VCDNPVTPATVEAAATIDSSGKEIQFPGKQVAGSNIDWNTVQVFMVTNQQTVQGQLNRYIPDLTDQT